MNCEEFLGQFRDALDGKVPEDVIQDNVNYYRSYIDSQAVGGRSEADVLRMLGDPRLLAKTIEESRKFAADKEGQGRYAGDFGSRSDAGSNYGTYNAAGNADYGYTETVNKRRSRIPGWLIACIVMVAVFLAVSFAFRAFVFLAPYIIVIVLAGFLVRTVQNWWRRR